MAAKEKTEKPASNEGERFEDLIASAEAIAKKLEGGQLTLEQSLAEWQKGMDLLKRGEAILSDAERRVEILTRAGDAEGGVRAVPFDEGAEGGESLSEGPRPASPPPRGSR